jgi:hypothetical protein
MPTDRAPLSSDDEPLTAEELAEIERWEADGDGDLRERKPREPSAQDLADFHKWSDADIDVVEGLLSAADQDFLHAIEKATSPEHARLVGLAWAEAMWASNGDIFDTPTGPMSYRQACEVVTQWSKGRVRLTP